MNGSSRRTPSLIAAVVTGVLVTALLPGLGGADTAPSLRARATSLDRNAHGALLELYALEASLTRARAKAASLQEQSRDLARRTDAARRSANRPRGPRGVPQPHCGDPATAVRGGPADPIAVLLGATSIDEALAGIESLERATDRNRRLVTDLSERLKGLRAAEARLATERVALTGAIAAAAAAERAAAAQVQSKRAYLAALQRERSLTDARLRDLQARARAAERASARLTATAATAPSAPAEKPLLLDDTSGTQTMVVDAVAYHLPGRTASGLPVGPGVVAVDPAVIPLGTRMFVPGYGPAVAADVGSAVKGSIIDLWFSTTAQALAWGRRTVTITLYL